jgi:hypothetical protein
MVDQQFGSDINSSQYANHLFVRVSAKERVFRNVDFKYTIFDTCYFRKCTFDNCDFTGCRFKDTNLVGSKFDGCRFDYAVFDKTYVENEILDTGCPGWENLTLRFARSLRANYQTLGDTASAKKALAVELAATESHLRKAWKSRESYYRKKYKGFHRTQVFFHWAGFKILDWAWGNGESILKLLRAALVIWLVMAIVHTVIAGDAGRLTDYIRSIFTVPAVAFDVTKPDLYPASYLTAITIVRLAFVAMFIAVLVRRLSRR